MSYQQQHSAQAHLDSDSPFARQYPHPMPPSSSQTTRGTFPTTAAGFSGTNRALPCTEASPCRPTAKTAAAGPTAAGILIRGSSDGWIGVSRSRQQLDLSAQQQYDHPGGKLVKHLKDLRAVQVRGGAAVVYTVSNSVDSTAEFTLSQCLPHFEEPNSLARRSKACWCCRETPTRV